VLGHERHGLEKSKDATEQRIAGLIDRVFLIAMLCFCVAIVCLFASFGFVYPIAFVLGCSSLIWIAKMLSKSSLSDAGHYSGARMRVKRLSPAVTTMARHQAVDPSEIRVP
jgi:hypothetical protein